MQNDVTLQLVYLNKNYSSHLK